jgi:carbonic anhydrase/acetyltransferase-like protein (isoleucine patch superfamily)
MPLLKYLDTFPRLAGGVFIHDSAQVIGDVTLGEDCSVWPGAVLRGDVHRIVLGRGTNFQDLALGHVTHKSPENPDGSPLIVGEFVTVGHSAILHGCTIGDECLIGMGSIVLDNAVLENRVLLGAGSLVPPGKILASGFLYLGRPAVKVRPLTDAELAYFRYSAENYIKVKNNYQK